MEEKTTEITETGEPTKPLPPITKGTSSILTRTKFFQRIVHWSFQICDKNGSGEVNQDELYAGILLVHLYLAKYAGAAACYPPSRRVVDSLFVTFDLDRSGSIDETEFTNILRICSVDIASRITIYYTILILLVPYVADAMIHTIINVDEYMDWQLTKKQSKWFDYMEAILTWNQWAEQILGLILLFLIIPIFFDFIDRRSTSNALDLSMKENGTSTTTGTDRDENGTSNNATCNSDDKIGNPDKKTV